MLNEIKRSEKNDTILFYFSGTGNSLRVALKIQEKINNCKIFLISKEFKEKNFEFDASRIGFVFPVYFLDIPHIVEKFLKKIKILGNPYIFAIATCGGGVGKSMRTINKVLLKQDKKLNAEFKVTFPSNSIVLFNKTQTPEEIARRINNSELIIDKIIGFINQNQNEKFEPLKMSFSNKFTCWMGKSFLFKILNDRTYKVNENKCNQCGICVSVCPMDNIKIIEGKVTWGNNCECCVACIHWCPSRAIENIGTQESSRYHHPEVTIKMMKSY